MRSLLVRHPQLPRHVRYFSTPLAFARNFYFSRQRLAAQLRR
ncbi:hypothetical protein [Lysobacter gummosus]